MLTLEDLRILDSNEILLTWSDDHRSIFTPKYLRLACPCAGCVDEWTGKKIIDATKIPDQVKLLNWTAVGRYALKLVWSDGHQTGIYSFEYLRQICLCESCKNERKGNEA